MTLLPDSLLYIDGVARPASNGKTFDVLSPWTGEVVAKAADGTAEDVDAAIAAARRAFDETDWSTNHARRYELVKKLRDILHANVDRVIEVTRHECGSPMGCVNGPHVTGALSCLDDLIRVFPEIEWEEDRGRATGYGVISDRKVVYEAIGVCAAITPWNVPFYINIGKVISALLAGCTVVMKPAPDTPVTSFLMAQLAEEAGIPPGVVNVVSSLDPAMAGEMLTTDPRVDIVSFTGSTAVGKRIMANAAGTLKRVFLELGGKSANIILDDAPDFATAVGYSMVVSHAGQGCAICTRLLVPRSRYQEAVAVLEHAYAAYADKWGDFNDPTHVMGPVISKRQLDRVLSYIELGQKEGARLLCGGKARPDKGGGYFVEPTCFVDVDNSMRIAQEEIFGPVLVVIPYDDDEDLVRIANDSLYGLSGMITSGDEARAERIARRIRTGSVGINFGVPIAGDLPFGGYRQSGIGREWGREGIEEFRESKVIAFGRGFAR